MLWVSLKYELVVAVDFPSRLTLSLKVEGAGGALARPVPSEWFSTTDTSDGTIEVPPASNSTVRINSTRLLYTVETGVSSLPTAKALPRRRLNTRSGDLRFRLHGAHQQQTLGVHGWDWGQHRARSMGPRPPGRRTVLPVGVKEQRGLGRLRHPGRRPGGDQNSLIASCTATCPLDGNQQIVVEKGSACTGVGCCQANIVLGYDFYNLQINKVKGSAYAQTNYVYIVDSGFRYNEDMTSIYGFYPEALPATLEWVISNGSCSWMTDDFACSGINSVCLDGPYNIADRGYRCGCVDGYHGNPYLPEGCQDIDECSHRDQYPCYGDCKNTPGGYICLCPTGYYGNASAPNGCKDINECDNQEAHSCYGICQNSPGTFKCQCPDGTYGDPSTKGDVLQ
ncbi:hypothetical protein PR202_gb02764 [Eleusine coracana subsp. coracana]|uniref:EGF-like domain-containing protein n=1 Tax=Eleusine coracana subsp. coracana TaxID=191504 RepID=A0AAV5DZV7_ELECO|nr:hypothetical protein PR202_gb02764 [Eleusine coracana subsp. coracana]